MRLKYYSKSESHDLTIDLKDSYIEDDKVFLDPFVVKSGFINVFKKTRIIRCITGISYYNYVEVPVAKINMGILRKYDKNGVKNYLDNKGGISYK